MINSARVVSALCHDWDAYVLPSAAQLIELQTNERVAEIQGLIDQLSELRAAMSLVHEQRLKLIERTQRWEVGGSPNDLDYCWRCMFFGVSFSTQDVSEIVKNVQLSLFKGAKLLPEHARLIDSAIIQRIRGIPMGWLNWRLLSGFNMDVCELLESILAFYEQRANSFEDIMQGYADLRVVFEGIIDQPEPHSLTRKQTSGMDSESLIETNRSTIRTDVIDKIECFVFAKRLAALFKEEEEQIIKLVEAHYQNLKMCLSDYSKTEYTPPAEISERVRAFKAKVDAAAAYNVAAPEWASSLVARLEPLITTSRNELAIQLRNLQRLKKKKMTPTNAELVTTIIEADRDAFVRCL